MSQALSRIVFSIALVFFLLFFVLPIWGTIQGAFLSADGSFTLAYVREIFLNVIYREGLLNSFLIAIWSTAGCLLLAIPLALLYVRYEFIGKTLLNSLVLAPLILPPFVGALGVQAIIGRYGALNALLINLGWVSPQAPMDWLGEGQMLGIIVMNILHLYPIVYLNAAAALANLDPSLDEAAANLGCAPWRRFWRITLPLIAPGIFAGATIAFIWAFTELGVPLIFDFDRVTSVQIFNAIKDLSNNPFPYALVVVLLVITTALYLLSKVLFERGSAAGGGRATMSRPVIKLSWLKSLLCSMLFALPVLLAVLPHVGVVLLSLAEDWYASVIPRAITLAHYRNALGHELTLGAIGNSLRYASVATLIDIVLGFGIAYLSVRSTLRGRQVIDVMAMLPLAVPGLVTAFGYLALAREGQILHWLMLGENPFLLLVVAYSVRRLPYVVRSVSASLTQVSPSLEEAAQSLGAAPERAVWRITLPLVAPGLIAGGLLAFAFAMLEVSDSMILAQQAQHFPITKAIYSLASALGDGQNIAAALGVWSTCFLGLTLFAASIVLGKKMNTLFSS
jgi:iron(III) transport system permease protein